MPVGILDQLVVDPVVGQIITMRDRLKTLYGLRIDLGVLHTCPCFIQPRNATKPVNADRMDSFGNRLPESVNVRSLVDPERLAVAGLIGTLDFMGKLHPLPVPRAPDF